MELFAEEARPTRATTHARRQARPHTTPKTPRNVSRREPRAERGTEAKARADRSSQEKLAELDGYKATPILSFPATADNEISCLTKRWETRLRYYEIRIEKDIFGTPVLMATNGGKGTKLGMMRVVAVGAQIKEALDAIVRRREAHGYKLVS